MREKTARFSSAPRLLPFNRFAWRTMTAVEKPIHTRTGRINALRRLVPAAVTVGRQRRHVRYGQHELSGPAQSGTVGRDCSRRGGFVRYRHAFQSVLAGIIAPVALSAAMPALAQSPYEK